jgi:hypothetical protein
MIKAALKDNPTVSEDVIREAVLGEAVLREAVLGEASPREPILEEENGPETESLLKVRTDQLFYVSYKCRFVSM